jgi:hypothetical protein
MPKTKTQAKARDKTPPPAPDIQKQPKTPEKQGGLSPAAQTTTSALSPPGAKPPAARAADLMMSPEQSPGAAGRARMMRAMQGTVGNARLSRMLGTPVQAKLTVGAPDDVYEQQADRTADEVMRLPEPLASNRANVSEQVQPARIQRLCPEREKKLQRQKEEEENASTATVSQEEHSPDIQLSPEGAQKLHRQPKADQTRATPKNYPESLIQRSPGVREDLQKDYKITIEKGDKNWSKSDLKDLKRALSKLSKKEKAVIEGYKFIRWSTKEARSEKDPTYRETGKGDCGQHEADIAKGTFKISMYDACFGDPEAVSDLMAGVPVGSFNILHELGHAMEIAEWRKRREAYDKVFKRYKKAEDDYNKASSSEQKKLEKKVDGLDKALRKAEKELDASKKRVITEFQSKIKGKAALTEYSKTDVTEAFAEAFALYKASPESIKKSNIALYNWFKKHGHLSPTKRSTKKRGSKKGRAK